MKTQTYTEDAEIEYETWLEDGERFYCVTALLVKGKRIDILGTIHAVEIEEILGESDE